MTQNKASKTALETEIIIVGGGLAGMTTAIGLAQYDFNVTLIDREKRADHVDIGFDGRSSAIAYASTQLLKSLGIWDYLAGKTQPILEIRVSDGRKPSLLHLHFDYERLEGGPLGEMVENRHNHEALLTRMDALIQAGKKLTYMDGLSVGDIETTSSHACVHLSNGQSIQGQFLIGADGRTSHVRRHAGIATLNAAYGQVGIVCTIEHTESHAAIAHERFMPSGPFAILPLTGKRSSLVWSEHAHLKDTIMGLSPRAFRSEVQRRCGEFLGKVTVIDDRRWAYPLTLQYAHKFTATRTAIIADAAHAMHPIAGQGLNMGLRDVAALIEVLVNARDLGFDIGSDSVLDNYAQWRQFDNASLLGITDALTRLFSNDSAPIQAARHIGMAAVNQFEPLKSFFMQHARGNIGELPKLLRGAPL